MAACLTLLAALELAELARVVRDQTQQWRRLRSEIARRQDAIGQMVASGDTSALRDIAGGLPSGVAETIELFDEQGHRVRAYPLAAKVRDWPTPEELRRVREGAVVTRPVAAPHGRMVSYLAVTWNGRPAVLRVVSPPGLAPLDRMPLLRSAAALLLLVFLALLLLPPPPESRASESGSSALRAYEEAMGRLQAQGLAEGRRHEQERRRLRTALHDKDAMARAGELTAAIVHEVRNGLATVVGYAQLIERNAGDAPENARQIREECATLETVVRRFVEFVKTEDLRLASFDLARLLVRVAAREGRGRPGGTVILPEGLGAVPVVGDEEMLERAFENLVRNARAAAGERGHVWLDVAPRADDVVVSVADDGPGMPADQRAEIRPFTTSKGGLGLGLATALKIVRLHAGEIVLSPRAPQGLEALVRLPTRGPQLPD